MAKSFLEAMEEALAPRAGRVARDMVQSARDKRKMDEGSDYKKLSEKQRDAALAKMTGGEVEDDEETRPIGNSSTEMEDDDQAYRITSGEEEVPEMSMEDFIGQNPEALARMAGGPEVEIEIKPSKPMGNSSTEMEDEDEAYRITSGEEPVASADMKEAAAPKFDKSSLWDPVSGARQAGVPMETLAAYFKATHGGSFDPNSRKDRVKMREMQDMIQGDKSMLGLSPTKFALKVYSRKSS